MSANLHAYYTTNCAIIQALFRKKVKFVSGKGLFYDFCAGYWMNLALFFAQTFDSSADIAHFLEEAREGNADVLHGVDEAVAFRSERGAG